MDIFVNNEVGEREATFKSAHGSTVEEVLETMSGAGFLVDEDGAVINAKRLVLPPGTYTFRRKLEEQQQQQQPNEELLQSLKNMSLALHGIQQVLPSVIVGHVVTPSTASRDRQVSSQIFEAVGLSLRPIAVKGEYALPLDLHRDTSWNFVWKWNSVAGDDKVLERTAYAPVLQFLRGLGLNADDVSEGRHCVQKLLYNTEIYTPRLQNPLEVRGQRVFHCHRVQGRTDLVVLRQERNGGDITRQMVQFAIEIKTVEGLNQSQDGCLLEAQLQLIGLNAFNVFGSPPVVLTNLARTHQVLYLDYKEDGWTYVIKRQNCKTFPAAVHFAIQKGSETGVSTNFSRPMTPELDV
ncbi:MAG: hypothetical protein SGILL_010016 [Bacillariaceae sp.]